MRTTIFIVAVVMLASLVAAAGCGPNTPEQSAPAGSAEQQQGTESVGAQQKSSGIAQTKCPVMGGQINKDIYVDYNGRRIYFCCAGCPETFLKDPEKYLKNLE